MTRVAQRDLAVDCGHDCVDGLAFNTQPMQLLNGRQLVPWQGLYLRGKLTQNTCSAVCLCVLLIMASSSCTTDVVQWRPASSREALALLRMLTRASPESRMRCRYCASSAENPFASSSSLPTTSGGSRRVARYRGAGC